MLNVVTWLWRDRGYRSTFTPDHVHTLYTMVARHYRQPFQPVCVTDDPTGLDPAIRRVPLWPDHRGLPSPHGGGNPGCYERLRAFAPDVSDTLGPRFVSIDLDAVIVGDLAPLWSRPDPFVIWHLPIMARPNRHSLFNGSMWLLETGAAAEVWTRFTGQASALEAYRAGCDGNDQGWMQYVLGTQMPGWTDRDGVYSYKFEILKRHGGELPSNARVVFFHGLPDCWSPEAYNRHAWIREHYR